MYFTGAGDDPQAPRKSQRLATFGSLGPHIGLQMRPPKKRKAPLVDRIAAFRSRRRSHSPLHAGQQEHAAPEKMADQEDAIHGDDVMDLQHSQQQDETVIHEALLLDIRTDLEPDARASDEQVHSESRLDLAHRNNNDQAQARLRPAPKSKQTARSQRIQSMLDIQQQASCQRSFDTAGSEAPPPRQHSAKDTGTDKDHGKGTTGAAGQRTAKRNIGRGPAESKAPSCCKDKLKHPDGESLPSQQPTLEADALQTPHQTLQGAQRQPHQTSKQPVLTSRPDHAAHRPVCRRV